MGTYIALVIEEKVSIGMVILRFVTTEDSIEEIVSFIQAENMVLPPLMPRVRGEM